MNLAQPLILAEVESRVLAAIARAERNCATVKTLLAAFAKFEGKPVNRRMETAAKAALPGMAVHLEWRAGMAYVNVWGGDTPYGDRVSLFLAYDKPGLYVADDMTRPPEPEGTYTYGYRCGHAWSYLRADSDLPGMRATLAALPAKVAAWNAARESLVAASAAFGQASWAVFPPR